MSERAVLTKTSGKKRKDSISQKPKKNFHQSLDSPISHILHLQRTIGNQAVQQLIKTGTIQAKLSIGKSNDKYEQDADRIADKVIRMPEPKRTWGNSHSSSVQRKSTCPECPEKEGIQTKPLAEQITLLVQRQENTEPDENKPAEYIQRKGTGLAAKVTYRHFVKTGKEVERDWNSLSKNERAKKLFIAANRALKKVDRRMPPLKGYVLNKGLASWEGEFDSKKWKMILSEVPFVSSTIIKKEMAAIVGVVYHEARHAEQLYRAARLEAGKGTSVNQIKRSYNLNLNVVRNAKRNPLPGKGRLVQEAKSWSISYTSKMRTKVYTTWKQSKKEYAKAIKDWNRASVVLQNAIDRKKNINDARLKEYAARQKVIAAKKKYLKALKDYKNLPEEKDAFAVGELAKAEYLRTPKAPQRHFIPKPPRHRIPIPGTVR